MTGLRLAVSFLTRVPVGVGEVAGGEMRSASPWFPAVGAGIGAVVTGVYALSFRYLPSLLAAVLAVTFGIWLTRAFHEDGLGDTSDAFGSGAEGERAFEIMGDPRLGTYGTVAVVASILWRVAALGSLGPAMALVGLVVAHTLARTGAVALMAILPPARTAGLSRSMVAGSGGRGVVGAVVSGVAIGVVVAGLWVLPAVLLMALVVAWFRRVSHLRLGGVTGDVLGACEQVGEMLLLAFIASLAWVGVEPWWSG